MIKLKELFDTEPGEVTDTTSGDFLHTYMFSLPDKEGQNIKYEVRFFISTLPAIAEDTHLPNKKALEVEFAARFGSGYESFSMHNVPGAQVFKVFSQVWKITENKLRNTNSIAFMFLSDKNEKSRERLYTQFAEMIDKKTEWKWFSPAEYKSSYGHFEKFIFIKEDFIPNIPVDSAITRKNK